MAGVLYAKKKVLCTSKQCYPDEHWHASEWRLLKARHIYRCVEGDRIEAKEIYAQFVSFDVFSSGKCGHFRLGARAHVECLYKWMEQDPQTFEDMERAG